MAAVRMSRKGRVTRLRFAAGVIFFVLMLILTKAGFDLLRLSVLNSDFFRLSFVTIDSLSSHVSRNEVKKIIAKRALGENLVALELGPIYDDLLRHPWIAKASLKKRFPDTLEAAIVEHEPAAIWKEQGLFDAATRSVFYPENAGSFSLVRLSAPYDYLAPEVYDSAVRLNRILRKHRLVMVRVDLNQVRCYEITLMNGTRLILGRDSSKVNLEERLERFLKAAEQGGIELNKLEYADLRYDSGFALKPEKIEVLKQ